MVRNQKIEPVKQETEQIFYCSNCGTALFESEKKFDVGSGFPSFWGHIGHNVRQNPLDTYGRHRIQLLCNTCKQHLGHLFDDNRTPTNVRYCINADALSAAQTPMQPDLSKTNRR
ncbi:peptide-methionine (R)-S-oxide reductase [Pontibacter sp. SGAir0037]|uniref:peptide-methionine (R)-S-oxide reductase n=1 Tax=Pontibacter sp. SGAir0037 TaxID=2571030 RepID=UPI0010CD415A|nr:peptide-methionine (R)-S-oxide reductase [Pontibacter sp. SGAir0037]QCR23976.1 methionine-R-sulfoxide reductase [Pontibacter sp. SGAir0037]